MPRFRKPGRKRKFTMGDIAHSEQYGWGAIVDRTKYGDNNIYYRFVRVLHPFNGAPYGEAIWVRAHELRKPTAEESVWNRTRKSVVAIYHANEKLEERGCRCNCCAHTSIPRHFIQKDGTYQWEEGVADE